MRRVILAGLLATLSLASLAAPVAAAPPGTSGPPDAVDEFDAGVVCSFPVRLEGWSNEKVRFGEPDRRDRQRRDPRDAAWA